MEKSESTGFSKPNVVIAKEKKKHDGMKNHLGPRKEHNKFKNVVGPKGPKTDVTCAVKPDHYARDCRQNKSKNEINSVHANDEIITIVSEIVEIKGKMQG